MKTNEQILDSWIGETLDYGAALSAMDEYSKQQCIAYAHFLFKKLYPIMMVPNDPPKEESEILYSQFIEDQQSTPPKTTE